MNVEIFGIAKEDLTACHEIIIAKGDRCKIIALKTVNDKVHCLIALEDGGHYGWTDINSFTI